MLPFDLSWTNLIYGPGPRVIAFVLNAQLNSLRTPDMLHLWFGLPSAACALCDAQNCTLHHVLVKCDKSLKDGGYAWRHDSVLINIEHAFVELIAAANKRKVLNATDEAKKCFESCFVRQGEKRKGPAAKPDNRDKSVVLMIGNYSWTMTIVSMSSRQLSVRLVSGLMWCFGLSVL